VSKPKEYRPQCLCRCHTAGGSTVHPRHFDKSLDAPDCCAYPRQYHSEANRTRRAFYNLLHAAPGIAPGPTAMAKAMGLKQINGRIGVEREKLLLQNGFHKDPAKGRWVLATSSEETP